MLSVGCISAPASAMGQGAGDCGLDGCDPPTGGNGGFKGSAALFDPGEKKVFAPSSKPSSCPECVWRTSNSCGLDGGDPCTDADVCGKDEAGEDLYNRMVFVTRGGAMEEYTGMYCPLPGKKLQTVEDMGKSMLVDWAHYLPPLRPTSQPKGGKTLANGKFATIFHSGQKSRNFGPKPIVVKGFPGKLTARGKWFWDFDDGTTKEFPIPGSHYPDKTVSHVYTEVGKYRPSVRTEWEGRFWVYAHGQTYGPYEVSQPAYQQPVPMDLEVVESLPVLGGTGEND